MNRRRPTHAARRTRARLQRTIEILESRLVLDAVGAGNGVSATDFGSIVPIVQQTGPITLSVDGVATNSSLGGTVQVQKPAGATVRSAYLASTTTGFSTHPFYPGGPQPALANGEVRIDGAGVNWSINTPSSIFSWNHWADVTSLVKPKLDASAAGLVNFTITETRRPHTEGHILAVIFDDPGQTYNNTVLLLFGAQNVGGDTFSVRFADPIDKSDPNLAVDMSLGISYGCQVPNHACTNPPAPQFSIVNINGARLTTSAGGFDDAQGTVTNGSLLTVGGIGDSNANPADPFSNGNGNHRYDDELYNLLPLVTSGASTINVFTQNPSNDDNIYFAAFNVRSATAIVGEGIVLGPTEASNSVGDQHTVTAIVQNNQGQPINGRPVTFQIVSGPHAGATATATTNSSGVATFAYTGAAAGNDQIQARFENSQGGTVLSNTVISRWIAANRPPSVSAGGPYSTDEGGAVELSALAMDLDGDDLTFAWDLDDNGAFETSGAIVTFSAAGLDGPGSRTVKVQADDGHGHVVVSAGTVHIANVAPTAALWNNGPVSEDAPVAISFSNQADPSLADAAAGFLYSYDFNNDGDFADAGELENVSAASASVLLPPGVHPVRARIQDKDGGFRDYTTEATVLNVVDLAGRVYDDLDNDGQFDAGESGFAGVVVELVRASDGSVAASATTAGDGSYAFDFAPLGPGTYTLRQQSQPSGWLDGKESIGDLDDSPADNGAVVNIADSNAITGIAIGAPGTQRDTAGYDFAEIRPSSLQGLVWEDFDNDAGVDFGETARAGVTITLSGTDDRGNAVSLSQTTDSQGIFEFADVRPGVYAISEVQLLGLIDGKDVVGSVNGVVSGDNDGGSPALATTNDQFTNIGLVAPGSTGVNYNFGERISGGALGSGQTATIGYWQNKNGQVLIESLNGSRDSTLLAQYLSQTFPNMYGGLGDANGDGFANDPMNNVQVAAFYRGLFKRSARTSPGGPPKLDSQVMAVALATYITKQSFVEVNFATSAVDGSLVAAIESFGFDVTVGGVGSAFVNVGDHGEAFQVADNTNVQIIDLLMATNRVSRHGLLYDDLDSDGVGDGLLGMDEETFRVMANEIYTLINEAE